MGPYTKQIRGVKCSTDKPLQNGEGFIGEVHVMGANIGEGELSPLGKGCHFLRRCSWPDKQDALI
jgi:hypothetical protein